MTFLTVRLSNSVGKNCNTLRLDLSVEVRIQKPENKLEAIVLTNCEKKKYKSLMERQEDSVNSDQIRKILLSTY